MDLVQIYEVLELLHMSYFVDIFLLLMILMILLKVITKNLLKFEVYE